MFLELHDDEVGNSLVARCPPAGRTLVYDYDYQLEVYADDLIAEYRDAPGLVCIKMFGGMTPQSKTHDSPLVAEWKVENGRRGERTVVPRPVTVAIIE